MRRMSNDNNTNYIIAHGNRNEKKYARHSNNVYDRIEIKQIMLLFFLLVAWPLSECASACDGG